MDENTSTEPTAPLPLTKQNLKALEKSFGVGGYFVKNNDVSETPAECTRCPPSRETMIRILQHFEKNPSLSCSTSYQAQWNRPVPTITLTAEPPRNACNQLIGPTNIPLPPDSFPSHENDGSIGSISYHPKMYPRASEPIVSEYKMAVQNRFDPLPPTQAVQYELESGSAGHSFQSNIRYYYPTASTEFPPIYSGIEQQDLSGYTPWHPLPLISAAVFDTTGIGYVGASSIEAPLLRAGGPSTHQIACGAINAQYALPNWGCWDSALVSPAAQIGTAHSTSTDLQHSMTELALATLNSATLAPTHSQCNEFNGSADALAVYNHYIQGAGWDPELQSVGRMKRSRTETQENFVVKRQKHDSFTHFQLCSPAFDVRNYKLHTTHSKITISSNMLASEIILHLLNHGCLDVTNSINWDACGVFPIAGGGFGDIYCGYLVNGIKIAIKCPRMFLKNDEPGNQTLKNVARELYAWSKLKHPNILELVGLTNFRDQIAMVSLWMDNGTLLEYISKNPKADRFHLCLQISAGLAYLHTHDTVHGDIKAINVLISEAGVAKITDFGNTILRKYTMEFTGATRAANISIRWTAPELLLGETKYTKNADIYALGMTFFEVVTGKPPFNEKVEQAVFVTIMKGGTLERPGELEVMESSEADTLWYTMSWCWRHSASERPSALDVEIQLKRSGRNGIDRIFPVS